MRLAKFRIAMASALTLLLASLFVPAIPFQMTFNCGGNGVQIGCPPFTQIEGFNSVAYTFFHVGASFSIQFGYVPNLIFVGANAIQGVAIFFILPAVIAIFLLLASEVSQGISVLLKRLS
ncbi:MAG: hypothetical protein JRN59_04900 [Nitrososphaerota archaeon]|nr:hypothetical protein [Nitrososphaerota archaeon]